MDTEAARMWMAEEFRHVDPAYIWDRRHPFHPVNRALTLELASILFAIAADLLTYDIDPALLLSIISKISSVA